jgi:hypothetical protein
MNRQQRRAAARGRQSQEDGVFDQWLRQSSNCMGFIIEERLSADARRQQLSIIGLSEYAIGEIAKMISESKQHDGVVARIVLVGGEPLGSYRVLVSARRMELINDGVGMAVGDMSKKMGGTVSGPIGPVGSEEFKALVAALGTDDPQIMLDSMALDAGMVTRQ